VNLNLHRVTKVIATETETMKNSLDKTFALRKITVHSDNGTFEIVLFADDPNNLTIKEES
jgi:hypothetical protein